MVTVTHPRAQMLMGAMSTACKGITRAVRKAGIAGCARLRLFAPLPGRPLPSLTAKRPRHARSLYGVAGQENASGDDVKKLDVLSNDIMVSTLINSRTCAVLVSEEEEEPIIVDAARPGPGGAEPNRNTQKPRSIPMLRRTTPHAAAALPGRRTEGLSP